MDNYRAAGAKRFILAGVIESEAEIPRYVAALGSARMFVCRLVARPEVLESRCASATGTILNASRGIWTASTDYQKFLKLQRSMIWYWTPPTFLP
ncbi:hypothetical protein AB0280_02630 [Pseudarthrobacter sp902506025]|uniref:hypothetical protein n=1 Tax=Pseudarthrobacter sp. 902506025 TaxID=3155291 RepID=UPI00344CFDBE